MFIGIDQSKRSTAVVAIDLSGELVDFMLVSPARELDGEPLLDFVYQHIARFVRKYAVSGIAVEGLSYNSTSSGKDLLAGLFWYIRTRLFVEYPDIPVGVIPVLTWRCKVIPKDERKAISELKLKDGIKKATVSKLPFLVKARFEQYITSGGAKKDAIYDLADAYYIAQHRRSIE